MREGISEREREWERLRNQHQFQPLLCSCQRTKDISRTRRTLLIQNKTYLIFNFTPESFYICSFSLVSDFLCSLTNVATVSVKHSEKSSFLSVRNKNPKLLVLSWVSLDLTLM